MILNCKYIFSMLNGSSDNIKDNPDPKHDPTVVLQTFDNAFKISTNRCFNTCITMKIKMSGIHPKTEKGGGGGGVVVK